MKDAEHGAEDNLPHKEYSKLQQDLKAIMHTNRLKESTEMITKDVNISPCTQEDVTLLNQDMPYGPDTYHEERLKAQEAGESQYLVARVDGRPVGHAELIFGGPKESDVSDALAGIPEINGMEVRPELRSHGIGSQLIKTAEQSASQAGYKRICMGVSSENPRARELYQKHGYTDGGYPRHKIEKDHHSFEGVYLVKNL